MPQMNLFGAPTSAESPQRHPGHQSPPRIAALCPTFCRPHLLGESIAAFCDQQYTLRDTTLWIGIDADDPLISEQGKLANDRELMKAIQNHLRLAVKHSDWPWMESQIHVCLCEPSWPLPDKYNHLAACARDRLGVENLLFATWEDDDYYLPHHFGSIAKAWVRRNRPQGWWGHPELVWSDYSGRPEIEQATGRFHAALALSAHTHQRTGWISTTDADFDQQYMARLRKTFGPPSHYDTPQALGNSGAPAPSYVFRWHTNSFHGQQAMGGTGDQWQSLARQSLRLQYEKLDPSQRSIRVEIRPETRTLINIIQATRVSR